MPDHPKSTPPSLPETPAPPGDDGDHLFRFTFLWRLRNPDDRAAMLQLARGFDDCMCEMGCWGEHKAPMILSIASALADDAEALGAYTLNLARLGLESHSPPEEVAIATAGLRWAQHLARLAVEIRATVAKAPGAS